MDKKEYVKKYLEPAIVQAQTDVVSIDYVRREGITPGGIKYNDELVTITYSDGWTRVVNVNADSCLGIMHDVLRVI